MAYTSTDQHRQSYLVQVQRLVRKRLRVAFLFSFLLLLLYGVYGYLMAADPQVSAPLTFLGLNRLLSLCLFAIITAIIVAGGYSWWTNKIYDPQIAVLREKLRPFSVKEPQDNE